MRLLFAVLAIASGLYAQAPPNGYSIQASTTKLTLQQPASGGNVVTGNLATVYCAAAQTATESWNGTAATATAGTIVKDIGTFATALATVWTGSNVGGGTTGKVWNVPAGQTFLLDISRVRMGPTGSATNYTITTNGTCTISIGWYEGT